MTKVSEYCDPSPKPVRQLLERTLADVKEVSASLCVNHDGTNTIDLWGDYTDEHKTTDWTRDALVPVWSASKLVTNLAALMLVDRGLLDLDPNVSSYWPKFAANGKEDIKVRHIISHNAGLSGWEWPVTAADIYDREAVTAKLAEQAPWWEPGRASGYHIVSQGHLVGGLVRRVGGLVRRVSGKALKQFIKDKIADPLGADSQLGGLEKVWPRSVNAVPPPPMSLSGLEEGSGASKSLKAGSSIGFGNARSLNAILSVILTNGEASGKNFLSPATIDRIFDDQAKGVDLVVGCPLRWGIGYALPGAESAPWIPDGKVCSWGRWGEGDQS